MNSKTHDKTKQMRKKLITSLIMIVSCTAVVAQTVKYEVSEETTMTISGTSTLHDWTSEVTEVKGFVEMDEGFAKKSGKPGADAVKIVHIVVPVKSIISPRGATMDKKTYAALKSTEHPEIVFLLKENQITNASAGAFHVDAKGALSIAGVTKEVEFPVEGKLMTDGTLGFTGSYKLNMVEYDMEPPSAMFGQIETGEEVEIKFELVVKK
jgi:hypothetical protein